jgi:O-6-methylguanine DNA methyltransferase
VVGPPAADSAAIGEAARLLVAAETPVIIAGRCARTPNGLRLLVELAETLQAPVQDRPFRFRMNFPTRHPLYGGGSIVDADVVLGLEDSDFWQAIHTQTPVNRMGMVARPVTKPGAKLITISSAELASKSNYQDFGRYAEVDLAIAADAEASLPMLIDACKRLITADRKKAFQERGAKLAEASRRAREQTLDQAAWGWDASPITTARLSAEVWNEIQNEDWSLVSDVTFLSFWPTRMWDFNKHHHYIGGQGAYGIGYGAPAAVGAALANRKHGRLTVNIQCDGDLNYAPGVLWTAAHHRIPLLTIMHNNRAYHQERMYVEDMAATAPYAARIFDPALWRKDQPLRVVLIGTDFEVRVWEKLLTIPMGGLTTYSDLAAKTGSPKAARAVGAAVGKNPICFVVPCHRVIGKGGDLTGYHWGITRKRAMLGWEAGMAAA